MMSTLFDFSLLGDWLQEPVGPMFGNDAEVESALVKDVTEVHSRKRLPAEDAQDVLADLLCNDYVDPLGEEWMDTVDLSHFLDDNVEGGSCEMDATVSKPKVIVESTKPTAAHALAILHSLLTQEVPSVSTPTSPEAQVCPEVQGESNLWTIHPGVSLDTIDPKQVLLDYDEQSIVELRSYLSLDLPLSPDDLDVDSILSGSQPSSPINDMDSFCSSVASSPDPSSNCDNSVDQDPDYIPKASSNCDNSVDQDPDYIPKASTSKRSRSRKSPKATSVTYVKPETVSPYLDRKERKKQQNKNAAIRYRMKKKAEAGGIRGEEDILLSRNLELKDKVDELSREIKYMKDLMTEVYKAKGLVMPKQ